MFSVVAVCLFVLSIIQKVMDCDESFWMDPG